MLVPVLIVADAQPYVEEPFSVVSFPLWRGGFRGPDDAFTARSDSVLLTGAGSCMTCGSGVVKSSANQIR